MSYKNESKRCRNFNDDGEPIGRGCMRSNCQFVHPTDPAWAQAQAHRRQNSDVNFNPSHSPDSGWGSRGGGPPNKTPSATKDWDTSVWDSPSKKKTDDNSTKGWGSQSSSKKDATAASPSPSVSYDWNMTSDKGGESSKSGTEGGWGNADLPATWGVDITSSWGGGDTGGGWGGSGGDGWGGEKTGDNTNTSWNDHKGKSKEKEREDVEMKDASPPKTAAGSLKPVSLNHNKPESAPPPLPPARNTPPPSTVASKPARPIPLPLPSKQKKAKLYEDGNLTKMALLSVKNKEAAQVQEKQNSPSFHGPKGRAELFSQVLKHTSTIAVLQVELQRAQRDLARWKRTQESSEFERASHRTRFILDQNRGMFNNQAQDAKRRLDRALSAVIDLPDFSSRNRKAAGPMLTIQTITAYTAELKDWIADVEQHKRILMEKEKEKADSPPASVEGTSGELQLTAQQLLERGKCSLNDIIIITNELETRLLNISEHVYSDVYTTIADFKDQTAGLQDPRPISPTTTTKGNQSDAIASTAILVGDSLSTQATRATELILKIHSLEQEHQHLENEIRTMNKFCAEAEVHFSQFEQWRQNDEAKIQQMIEQSRTLHLHHRSTPRTSIPKIPPAQLDDMVLRLRPIVIDHLQNEVQPILDALRSRCLENLEGSKSLIEEHVTPALVMTDDICHRVSTLSCDEILNSK